MEFQLDDHTVTLPDAKTLHEGLAKVDFGNGSLFYPLLEQFAGKTIRTEALVNGYLPTAYATASYGASFEGDGIFFSVLCVLLPGEADYAYACALRKKLEERNDGD